MSFRRTAVEEIDEFTDMVKREYATAIFTTDTEADARFVAAHKQIDGLWVTRQCAEFAEAIRKANRAVKFGVARHGSRWDFSNSTRVFKSLHAYIPGQQFSLGEFGYADNAVRGVDYKYFVYARDIANEKYQSHRDQHYMVMSGDLKRAVEGAKKHLRPYSPIEMARLSFDSFRHEILKCDGATDEKVRSARLAVLNSNELREELFALVESDYAFINPTLKQNIINWKRERNEMTTKQKESHGFYIQVTTTGDKQSFEVIEVFDIKKGQNSTNWGVKNYGAEDMPAELSEKIATLMMLDPMNYIEGVGMRTSEKAFWIERDMA